MTEKTDFGALTIAFDDRVLRPRGWTVAQSEWAAEIWVTAPAARCSSSAPARATSGCSRPRCTGRGLVCVDANPVACDFARANALTAGLADRVEVREGRLETALAEDERFPVVIADPPWVPRDQTSQFPEDPLLAIDGGGDGLDVARACLQVIADHLAPGGSAVLQLGTTDQAEVLRSSPASPTVASW